MPQQTKSATSRKGSGSSRSRPTGASKPAAGRSKSASNGRGGRSSSRRTTGSAAKSTGTSSARRRMAGTSASRGGAKRRSSSASRPSTVKQLTTRIGGVARKARLPVLATGAAAVAVAGAALLKQQLAPKRRKILGVSVSRPDLNGLVHSGSLELKPIGKSVSKAGKRVVTTSRQMAKLSNDVERAGKTAQKVGDSIS